MARLLDAPRRQTINETSSAQVRVDRKHQINLWYLIAAIFAVIWLRDIWVTSREVEPVPYSRFLELLEQGKIVAIAIRDKIIQASLKEPLPNGEKKIVATRVEPD